MHKSEQSNQFTINYFKNVLNVPKKNNKNVTMLEFPILLIYNKIYFCYTE